jgi:SAM-dependent methyltransferase
VVISLQAAARMLESGLDWKKSISEAARVLKPGGRLLFVEQTELAGESYLDFIQNMCDLNDADKDDENNDRVPIFEVGFDEVDLVLMPHIAGVAIKFEDAGLTADEILKREEEEEKDRLADLSIAAYERGIKKRRKKKASNNGAAQTSTGSPKV